LLTSSSYSQNSISGKVTDAKTKKGLAFATIIVPNTLLGTVTNENGEFELKLTEKIEKIQASYIGYSDQSIEITDDSKNILISLKTQEVSLDEIIVRSKTPLQFIIEAVANYPENISQTPFETRGYFSEKTSMLNDKTDAFKLSESVFKSYLSIGTDTTEKDQNQLTLLRNSQEGNFDTMLDEGKKIKRKIEKGKVDFGDENGEGEDSMNIDVDGLSGEGPSESLQAVKSLLTLPFLDKNYFKRFEYTFGTPTTYQGKELIAIDFVSKRKVEMSKYNGSIFLDYNNLAVVAVIYKENLKIPFYVNMLIKGFVGFKIDEVNQNVNIQNQSLGDVWYPKKIQKTGEIYFLQQKQTEIIKLSQLFSIDKINATTPSKIDKPLRFDSDKDKEDQVYPIPGLDWEDVNVVKQ